MRRRGPTLSARSPGGRARRRAVRLRKPSRRWQADFLEAVARSRRLHAPFATPPGDSERYAQYVRRLGSPDREGFLVVTAEENELVGVVNVSEIVRGAFQSAYLGYYAFVPHAGKGLMRQGLALVIDRCFNVLRLHRLEANVQPENRRSIALVRGLGFRLEGLSPRYLKIGGRWRDHERWALLREEWPGVARAGAAQAP